MAAAPTTAPDQYHHACPGCGHLTAVYHRSCPQCAYDLSRSWTHPPGELPQGWTATPLADGTVRLKRTRFGHANASGTLVLLPFLVLWLIPSRRGFGRPEVLPVPFLIVFGLLFGVVALAVLAWMVFGEEWWELRPGELRIRKRLFGREWTKQYADAELSIRTIYGRGRTGTQRSHQLIASVYGRPCVLSEGTWMGLAEMHSLGGYIAAITGWPFRTSPDYPEGGGFSLFGT